MDCALESSVGRVLDGRYELVCRIGAGGMGAVYEARHIGLGRRCAVKMLLPELAQHPRAVQRFEREAKSAGALENEHIVSVTDCGRTEDGAPYLVMELLVGTSLRGILSDAGHIAAGRTVNLANQACLGLSAAHARGIVHRDLKPENLFIARRSNGEDHLKLLDFGIAKLLAATQSGLNTHAGSLIGTLAYMPPEQVRGEDTVDERADIYSLGAVMYECLAGQPPHPGNEPHVVMYRVLNEAPPAIETLRPGLPACLARLVHRMLAIDAGARPQTIEDVRKELCDISSALADLAESSPHGSTTADSTTTTMESTVWSHSGCVSESTAVSVESVNPRNNRQPSDREMVCPRERTKSIVNCWSPQWERPTANGEALGALVEPPSAPTAPSRSRVRWIGMAASLALVGAGLLVERSLFRAYRGLPSARTVQVVPRVRPSVTARSEPGAERAAEEPLTVASSSGEAASAVPVPVSERAGGPSSVVIRAPTPNAKGARTAAPLPARMPSPRNAGAEVAGPRSAASIDSVSSDPTTSPASRFDRENPY